MRSTNELKVLPFPEKIKEKGIEYHEIHFLSSVRSMMGVLFRAGSLKSTGKLVRAKISGKGMDNAVKHFSENVDQVELYKVIAFSNTEEISQVLKLVANNYLYPINFFCSHGFFLFIFYYFYFDFFLFFIINFF